MKDEGLIETLQLCLGMLRQKQINTSRESIACEYRSRHRHRPAGRALRCRPGGSRHRICELDQGLFRFLSPVLLGLAVPPRLRRARESALGFFVDRFDWRQERQRQS
jgi:hypothetical protein